MHCLWKRKDHRFAPFLGDLNKRSSLVETERKWARWWARIRSVFGGSRFWPWRCSARSAAAFSGEGLEGPTWRSAGGPAAARRGATATTKTAKILTQFRTEIYFRIFLCAIGEIGGFSNPNCASYACFPPSWAALLSFYRKAAPQGTCLSTHYWG